MPTYSMVPIEVVSDKRLNLQDMRVYIALKSYTRKDEDVVYPSRRTLAELTGIRPNRISEVTTKLERCGWLEKLEWTPGVKTRRYRMLIPDIPPKSGSTTRSGEGVLPNSGSRSSLDMGVGTPRSGDIEVFNEVSTEVESTSVAAHGDKFTKDGSNTYQGDEKKEPLRPTGKKSKKCDFKYPDDFEAAWKTLPGRTGSNDKRKAFSAWKARLKDGHTPEQMTAGAERYRRYCDGDRKTGTQYVMQAVTFFGPADPPNFANDWRLTSQRGITNERFDDYGISDTPEWAE